MNSIRHNLPISRLAPVQMPAQQAGEEQLGVMQNATHVIGVRSRGPWQLDPLRDRKEL